ncbi:MAG: polysaccharide deacetylase family protein [Spirochaetales bacterium]|nr:polysaccharide deacetylase family protein [Spirochaetales bacterium]
MKLRFTPFVLLLSVHPLCAGVFFSGPDLNGKNEVIFAAHAELPGNSVPKTLYRKSLGSLSSDPVAKPTLQETIDTLEPMTIYPESMEVLADGSVLQVRSRFGTGRYDTRSDSFRWVQDGTAFHQGGYPRFGALADLSVSPNGRWIVSVEPVSAARGRLVLFDAERSFRSVISDSVERSSPPVSWAPDSSVFLYELDRTIYFARPEAFFTSSQVDQKFRMLGSGSVSSVAWYSPTRFLYANGTSVYRIQSAELFARSLYNPLLGLGELAGKLPSAFNPSEDSFRPSPDGQSLLFAQDARNVYFCPLTGDDYVPSLDARPLPYLQLPGNTASVSLFWNQDGSPAVFTCAVEDGKKTMRAWKLDNIKTGRLFSPLAIPSDSVKMVPSREGRSVAFITARGLAVYDASGWKEVSVWQDEPVVSAAWADESSLYIGGSETIRKWNSTTGAASLLLLSSVTAFGWDEQGVHPLADTTRLGRFQFLGNMKWQPAASARMRPATGANGVWRLYADSSAGYYNNMLYLRSAAGKGGTRPLLTEPGIVLDSLSSGGPKRSSVDDRVFSHGLRSGYRHAALVFDAMDTVEGLPEILYTLSTYNIRATFFINGEFLRRHPGAVNEIVKAGHQTASLFFTSWDLSGTGYRIDEDFIIRGLSRNEDDFYNATGQELTLLWHAPYYTVSPLILDSGAKAGYRYVLPDVPVLDWVTREHERLMPGLYLDSADIIDSIMKAKKPGSIIPVRIGKVAGSRSDYLYEKIDLLVNALMEAGYAPVSVDTLQKNSR